MFPIRDHNPSDRTPFVTWALIAINIAIFLSYYPGAASDQQALLNVYGRWGLQPVEVSNGLQYSTIFTSMFLHGGWMHLAGNMLFLWIFGDNLEDLLGHVGFLRFYLVSGAAAAAGQIYADTQSFVPMVGASGAIAGVMGGYLLMFPKARIDVLVIIVIIFKIFPMPAWLMLGIWFALQVFNGLSMDLSGGGVAYWAHAGGFVAGVVVMLPVFFRRGGRAWWAQTHGKPPHQEVNYVVDREGRSRIPRVRRVSTPRDAARPLSDLGRVPRSGTRHGAPRPWSGGRE